MKIAHSFIILQSKKSNYVTNTYFSFRF